MLKNAFIDWITITQFHPRGGLPVIVGGLNVTYDRNGIPVYERAHSSPVLGSFNTSVRITCDGYRVSLSGNAGRFGREDNLYGFGIQETIARCNLILESYGLPPFHSVEQSKEHTPNAARLGAYISRLDFTVNYSAGSESRARSAIRSISNIAVSRVKRGNAGDESYWFANTRWMFKVYIKHLELLKHGLKDDNPVYQHCRDNGILRFEVELKKRLLSELNMNTIEELDDEKLYQLFKDQTAFARKFDCPDIDILCEDIPKKSRVYAEAWLRGVDLKNSCSRATLFRHAKVLREFGFDILQVRNIQQMPVQVRIVDLLPMNVPDWYHEREDHLLRRVA